MDHNKIEYHAFISYRHLDNVESGRQWATWLHQTIETYRVPSELVGKINNRGEPIPERVFPIFRDEEALPADADLSNSIVRALEQSKFLIVLCSPRSRTSTFVADEIDYFKKLGRSNHIIAGIIDGEPNTSLDDGKIDAGFTKEDECFPIPLQYTYDEKGNRTNSRSEPIASDFRVTLNNKKQQGWTSPEALKQFLVQQGSFSKSQIKELCTAYEKQINLMLLKIIAGIIGVPLDDLTQRDKEYQLALERQRAKRLRQWLAVIAILAVFAIGAGAIAWQQKEQATRERNSALSTQSLFLADLGRQKFDQHRYNEALLLGLNATPGDYGGERPLVSEARDELYKAAINQSKLQAFDQWTANKFIISPDRSTVLLTDVAKAKIVSLTTFDVAHTLTYRNNQNSFENVVSADFDKRSERLLVGTKSTFALNAGETYEERLYSGTVELWSVKDGNKILSVDYDDPVNKVIFGAEETKALVASDNGTASVIDLSTGSIELTLAHSAAVTFINYFEQGKKLLTITEDQSIMIWSTDTGEEIHSFKFEHQPVSAVISNDESLLLVTLENQADLYSLDSFKRIQSYPHNSNVPAIFSSNDNVLTTEYYSINESATLGGEILPVSSYAHEMALKSMKVTGDRLVTTDSDNRIYIWSMTDKRLLKQFHHDATPEALELFEKDNKLITSSDSGIVVWDASPEYQDSYQLKSTETFIEQPHYTPSGKRIVDSVNNKQIKSYFRHLPNDKVVNSNRVWPEQWKMTYDHQSRRVLLPKYRQNATLLTLDSHTSKELLKSSQVDLKDTVFSSDDRSIALVGSSIKIYDTNDGRILFELNHSGATKGFFINDNSEFVSFSQYDVIFWSLKTGEVVSKTSIDKAFSMKEIALTPNKNNIFIYSEGRYRRFKPTKARSYLISPKTRQTLLTFEHERKIEHPLFSSDGKLFIAPGADRFSDSYITYWSLETGERLASLEHKGFIENVGLVKNGQYLYSWTDEKHKTKSGTTDRAKALQIWSVPKGEKISEVLVDHELRRVEFSADNSYFLTKDGYQQAKLWNTISGNLVKQFSEDNSNYKLSPIENKLYVSHDDQTLEIYSGPHFENQKTIAVGHKVSEIKALANNSTLALVGEGVSLLSSEDEVLLYDELADFISPTGDTFFASTAIDENFINVREANKNGSLKTFGPFVNRPAFSIDKKEQFIAVMVANADGASHTLQLLDFGSGELIEALAIETERYYSPSLTLGGDLVVYNQTPKTLKTWSLFNNSNNYQHSEDIDNFIVSAKGDLLAVYSADYRNDVFRVTIWSLKDHKIKLDLPLSDKVYDMAFDSQQNYLAIDQSSSFSLVNLKSFEIDKTIDADAYLTKRHNSIRFLGNNLLRVRGGISLWDLSTDSIEIEFDSNIRIGDIYSYEADQKMEKLLINHSYGGTLFSIDTGKVLQTFPENLKSSGFGSQGQPLVLTDINTKTTVTAESIEFDKLYDYAISKLINNKRCLTVVQRELFYLPAVGDNSIKRRDC